MSGLDVVLQNAPLLPKAQFSQTEGQLFYFVLKNSNTILLVYIHTLPEVFSPNSSLKLRTSLRPRTTHPKHSYRWFEFILDSVLSTFPRGNASALWGRTGMVSSVQSITWCCCRAHVRTAEPASCSGVSAPAQPLASVHVPFLPPPHNPGLYSWISPEVAQGSDSTGWYSWLHSGCWDKSLAGHYGQQGTGQCTTEDFNPMFKHQQVLALVNQCSHWEKQGLGPPVF